MSKAVGRWQVPPHLRDAHYGGAAQLGSGEGYQYSHDYEGGYVQQQYLPEERRYYEPMDRGYEAEIRRLTSGRRGPPGQGSGEAPGAGPAPPAST